MWYRQQILPRAVAVGIAEGIEDAAEGAGCVVSLVCLGSKPHVEAWR